MMQPDNWFFAIEGPEDAGSAVASHLQRLKAGQPRFERRDFALAGRRNATVVYVSGTRTVESARFWLFVAGARPPDAHLQSALRRAGSDDEIERLCISPEAADHSFLVIDKQARTIRLITDRLNVSRVFYAEMEGLSLLSSHISPFPRPSLTVDPGAVASYVLNRACINNRTVFREVAVLERAAVHEFRPDGRYPQFYWQYAPGRTGSGEPWQPRTAEAALWELAVKSVDNATRGKRVLLALSGGYDSAVLLGILGAKLRHPDVTCFSYVYGKPMEDSDAAVAARQAAVCGYRHFTLSSYSGDLLGMLDSNAEVGQALRCPSYEIEVFPLLAKQGGGAANSVVLFGDECFGAKSFRLSSADDTLGAAALKSPSLLDALGPAIDADRVDLLRAGLEAEYAALRRKAAEFGNADDAKDYLYLDQLLQFNLLPLRTFIAGTWLPVTMPFLNPDILDYMATVPTSYRLDKRLFRQVARRFLPELFRVRRATRAQFAPDFSQELSGARGALEAAIMERGWKIDGLVTAEELIRLLSDFCAIQAQGARLRRDGGIRTLLKSTGHTLFAMSRFLEDRQQLLRRLVYNEFARVPGRWFLLLNLLCLADFLADRPPPSVTEGKPLT